VACYRLIFRNDHAFCVDFLPNPDADPPDRSCRALLYRVTNDARDATPMHRRDGEPIEIRATSEAVALAIAHDVLTEVAGARLELLVKCVGWFAEPESQ